MTWLQKIPPDEVQQSEAMQQCIANAVRKIRADAMASCEEVINMPPKQKIIDLLDQVSGAMKWNGANDMYVIASEDLNPWLEGVAHLVNHTREFIKDSPINPQLQEALDEMQVDEMIPVEKDMHCNLTIAMQTIEYLLKQLKNK